jgi:hypothetical protein
MLPEATPSGRNQPPRERSQLQPHFATKRSPPSQPGMSQGLAVHIPGPSPPVRKAETLARTWLHDDLEPASHRRQLSQQHRLSAGPARPVFEISSGSPPCESFGRFPSGSQESEARQPTAACVVVGASKAGRPGAPRRRCSSPARLKDFDQGRVWKARCPLDTKRRSPSGQ